MGLDAVVRCRCWEERRISTPPPYPEHVRLDEEDYLRLDLPWRGNEEKHDAFEQWLEQCCPHPRMERASEWIASWAGLRLFQGQLMEFEIDQFPTLRDVLPNGNGGLVPAAASATALAELDDFARRDFGTKVVLVEVETGEELQQYIPIYDGWFMSAPGNWTGGVDPAGFFVRGPAGVRAWLARMSQREGGPKQRVVARGPGGFVVTQPARDPVSVLRRWLGALARLGPTPDLFRSMHFRQEQLGPHAFRLTDVRSGRSVVSPLGVSKSAPWPDGRMQDDEGRGNTVYPSQLIVERRKRQSDEFDYILRPLRTVFQASVETGNPVRWL